MAILEVKEKCALGNDQVRLSEVSFLLWGHVYFPSLLLQPVFYKTIEEPGKVD
jgi:hypothetical protein